MTVSYNKLPAHMQEAARLYVERGIQPGSFLRAVLENNLTESFGQADDENRLFMFEWARWLYNDAPGGCWGSKDVVAEWINRRGLKGKDNNETTR